MEAIPLVFVALFATALRFHGLSATGIFDVDDGRYILDGYSKLVEAQGVIELCRGTCTYTGCAIAP